MLTVTITARRDSLSIDKALAAKHWQTEIRAEHIDDILPRISGSSNGRASYSIAIIRRAGPPVDLYLVIRDKPDATWIAGELKKGLGIAIESPSA